MALGRMSTTRTHASPSAEPIRHLTCADIMTTIRGTQPAAAVIVHTVCRLIYVPPLSLWLLLARSLTVFPVSHYIVTFSFLLSFFQLIRTEWSLMTQDSFFFGWGRPYEERQKASVKGAEKKRRERAYQKGGKEAFHSAIALSMKAVVSKIALYIG